MPLPWPLPRFVGRSCKQELYPVLKAILGEYEIHLVKLVRCNAMLLGGFPESGLQLFPVIHVMVQIRPHHQRRIATHLQASPEF